MKNRTKHELQSLACQIKAKYHTSLSIAWDSVRLMKGLKIDTKNEQLNLNL